MKKKVNRISSLIYLPDINLIVHYYPSITLSCRHRIFASLRWNQISTEVKRKESSRRSRQNEQDVASTSYFVEAKKRFSWRARRDPEAETRRPIVKPEGSRPRSVKPWKVTESSSGSSVEKKNFQEINPASEKETLIAERERLARKISERVVKASWFIARTLPIPRTRA